jgi:hypothetical protein
MSHRKWDRPASPEATRDMVAHVKGYILACRDILRDYEHLADMDDMDDRFQMLAEKVDESLRQAQETMEKLT